MTAEELISAVFHRRPLWDPTDPLHENVGVLKKLWDDIYKKLNIAGTVAKTCVNLSIILS